MPYDEIHDDSGAERPPYAAVQAMYGLDVTRPAPRTLSALAGANIHPVPLVLDDGEYRSVLVPGVVQRALMLQALFADLAIGSARLIERGVLRGEEVERILEAGGLGRTGLRGLWKGQSREQVRFVYGPDLARGADGEWVVLEDNVGCVGGVAEAGATRDTYLEAVGLAAGGDGPPRSDLSLAIERFLDRIGVRPHCDGLFGFAGWTSPGGCDPNDRETRWKADCLRSFGIAVVEPEELAGRIRGGEEPAAIVNLSSTLAAGYLELARVVFGGRRVPVFGAPGVELVASKSFLPFDRALATELLGEPLRLRSAPSRLVRERPDRLPGDGVLKRSAGCQGSEVYFLDELRDPAASRDLLDELAGWGPCAAIVQQQVTRSVLGDPRAAGPAALEIRPIVYVVGWQTAVVGEAVAGRAVAAGGARRGNVSRGARFLPVLRHPSSDAAGWRDRVAGRRTG